MHSLRVTITQQSHSPPLATDAALLVPAEESLRIRFLPAVDPDAAGLELAADALGTLHILAPDAGAEAGFGVVGAADDFVFIGEGLAGYDGAYVRLIS